MFYLHGVCATTPKRTHTERGADAKPKQHSSSSGVAGSYSESRNVGATSQTCRAQHQHIIIIINIVLRLHAARLIMIMIRRSIENADHEDDDCMNGLENCAQSTSAYVYSTCVDVSSWELNQERAFNCAGNTPIVLCFVTTEGSLFHRSWTEYSPESELTRAYRTHATSQVRWHFEFALRDSHDGAVLYTRVRKRFSWSSATSILLVPWVYACIMCVLISADECVVIRHMGASVNARVSV